MPGFDIYYLTIAKNILPLQPMNQPDTVHEQLDSLTALEKQLEKLLAEHAKLIEENETLRREHQNLAAANRMLTETNQRVQQKIEALLERLRLIEKS